MAMKLVTGYETWSELDLLTGLIIGEARGETTSGKIGVALTAKTRAENPRWWGRNWREVILCRNQFSCWLDHNADVIREAYRHNGQPWKDALRIAEEVYCGCTVDFIGKPTHYHALSVSPAWAAKMQRLAKMGNHIFYRDPAELKCEVRK